MELSRDQQNISHEAVMDGGAFPEAEHGGCPAHSRVLGGGDLLVGRGPAPTPVDQESATRQPFFNLQLDIQSDKIRTVQDVLGSLVARESVQGDTTKTEQEQRHRRPQDVSQIRLKGWGRAEEQTATVISPTVKASSQQTEGRTRPTAERAARLLRDRIMGLL
ncbi:unnamed protein product [Rangifer tarandus platyrhynchus]|uniref:Uncharacterized protein n=1 Tax=Rangifer tarandus platyrhynchus TaxID=3082113 RepID=A0AC60A4X5_RANTA